MRPDVDFPRDVVDRMVRDSLARPANLEDFLYVAAPQHMVHLDVAQARPVQREFLGDDWRGREADLVFEIPWRMSAERSTLVFLLLEHQSDTEPVVPLRTLLGVAAYWGRQWREWEAAPAPRGPLRLRPVLPIVLYTADRVWGSAQRVTDLLDDPEVLHPLAPDWGPIFWNLAARSSADLLAGRPWVQFLAVMRASAEETATFLSVLEGATRNLAALRDVERVRWSELLRMVLDYALWRRTPQERQAILETERRTNPARTPEEAEMGESAAHALIREGMEQEARRALLAALRARFGEIPQTVVRQIEQLSNLTTLQGAHDRALTVPTLEEFTLAGEN